MISILTIVLTLSCSKENSGDEPIQEKPSCALIAEFTVDITLHNIDEDFQFFDQSEFVPTTWPLYTM